MSREIIEKNAVFILLVDHFVYLKKNKFCKYFRVWRHFEAWLKKGGLIGGTSSDYLLPSECCVMVNVILDCKAQVNN